MTHRERKEMFVLIGFVGVLCALAFLLAELGVL